MDLIYYLNALNYNLDKSSRTISKGIVDKSTSVLKDVPAVVINSEEELKNKARENSLEVIKYLYNKREKFNYESFKKLFFELAKRLNGGIVSGEDYLRKHEIKVDRYGCKVNEIVDQLNLFFNWAVNIFNINLTKEEVFENSALIEKIIDTDIHPLSDGCGRIGKILSMYLSIRNDAPVKKYSDREEYYRAMGQKNKGNDMFDKEKSRKFIDYYLNLDDF